jgi:group I intron endonuclease
MLIYKITNNMNDKCYIGQTIKTIEDRISNHKQSAKRGENTKFYNAIRKYGWDNFSIEVIATTDTQETLDELETYFIKKYDSVNNGYNMSYGGEINPMNSPEVVEKHKKRMQSPEVRAKISASMKARIAAQGGISDEHRKHVSEGLKKFYADGKKPNYKEPQHLSPEHFKALNDAKNKAVKCIDMDGILVAEFKRVKDAANWWYQNGYNNIKSSDQLNDRIKESATQDKYIRGLKWIYCV